MALTEKDIAAIERIIDKNYNSIAHNISRSFEHFDERLGIAVYHLDGHFMTIEKMLGTTKQDAPQTPLAIAGQR